MAIMLVVFVNATAETERYQNFPNFLIGFLPTYDILTCIKQR